MEQENNIRVLMVEPGKAPYEKEIGSDLASLQREVGGYIQAVYPFEEPIVLLANEEGKLEGLPLNRALRDEDGDIYDVVAGTFFIAGLGDDNFCSLSDEHLKKFKDVFKTPEMFVRMNGKLVVIPVKGDEVKERKPSVLGKLEAAKQQRAPSSERKPVKEAER